MTPLFFLFVGFLFSNPSYQGLSAENSQPSRAYLERDTTPGRWTSLEIVEIVSFREFKGGASYQDWFYWNGPRNYRGAELVWVEEEWVATGRFRNVESSLRASLLIYCSQKWSTLDSAPLLDSLLLGQYNQEIQGLFRQCGLSFLLALSGMHSSLLLIFLSRSILLLVPHRARFPMELAVLIFFLWLTGFRHSLFRAVIMYLLYRIFSLTGKTIKGPQLLGLCASFHLFMFPMAWQSLSFQLSYAAILGIFLLTPRIEVLLSSWMPLFLRKGLALSLGAQLAVSPILAWTIGDLHPFSLLSALLMTPMVAGFLWIGLIYLLLPPVPFVSSWIEVLLDFGYNKIMQFGTFLSSIPAINTGSSPWKALLSTVLCLSAAILVIFHRSKEKLPNEEIKSKLRLSHRNPGITGYDGTGPKKEMGAELPY